LQHEQHHPDPASRGRARSLRAATGGSLL